MIAAFAREPQPAECRKARGFDSRRGVQRLIRAPARKAIGLVHPALSALQTSGILGGLLARCRARSMVCAGHWRHCAKRIPAWSSTAIPTGLTNVAEKCVTQNGPANRDRAARNAVDE